MTEVIQSLIVLIGQSAWPLFCYWLLIKYEADIRTLLPRIRKFNSSGFELDSSASTQNAEEIKKFNKDTDPKNLKEFTGIARSEAIAEVELALHKSLEDQVQKSIVEEDDKVDYLIRELAISRLISHFLRVYNIIFGSQIRGLQILNHRGSVSLKDAQDFFDEVKNADPLFYDNYKFEEWLNFLIQAFLIQVEGDQIKITPAGFDFLQFILANKLNTEKRG